MNPNLDLLISCQDLGITLTGQTLFSGISFGVHKGQRIGLVGPNGAGKSTFLRLLAGQETPTAGQVMRPKDCLIAYVPQERDFEDLSIAEVLKSVLSAKKFDSHEADTAVHITLGKFGFTDPSARAKSLSGGWQKRLSLAMACILDPDLLLIDEPTNHLDLESIVWLEGYLRRQLAAFIVISHDRTFLQNTVTKMMEIAPCYPKGLFAVDGSYDVFVRKSEEFLEGQMALQQSMSSKARREVDWLRSNAAARTTKQVARIQEANKLLVDLADVKKRNRTEDVQVQFQSTERETKNLLTIKSCSMTLGGKQLFTKLNLTLTAGMRLGIVGANGTGKTTLMKLIAGTLEPQEGTIKRAQDLKIVYFDQKREQLNPSDTIAHAIYPYGDTITFGGKAIHINGWGRRFGFMQDQMDRKVSELSGGQRARVCIARLMLQEADILLLDEPSNDLDIPTLEALEDSLCEYPGALVMITHDRRMMENVCTQIVGLGLLRDASELLAGYGQWESLLEASKKPKQVDAKPQAENASNKAKLSWKEKQFLDSIDSLITAAEAKVAAQQQATMDPKCKDIAAACAALATAQAELDKLFDTWQELENRKSS